MARQYVLELVVDLPEDPHLMSDVISKTADPVKNLKDALEAGGITYNLKSHFRSKTGPRAPKDRPEVLQAAE